MLPIEKTVYTVRTYVKITMRMLTILREAEEWTHVHLRVACLLFSSAIMKSSHDVRQNDKAHAQQIIVKLKFLSSNNFTFACPLMGTIFLVSIDNRGLVWLI